MVEKARLENVPKGVKRKHNDDEADEEEEEEKDGALVVFGCRIKRRRLLPRVLQPYGRAIMGCAGMTFVSFLFYHLSNLSFENFANQF